MDIFLLAEYWSCCNMLCGGEVLLQCQESMNFFKGRTHTYKLKKLALPISKCALSNKQSKLAFSLQTCIPVSAQSVLTPDIFMHVCTGNYWEAAKPFNCTPLVQYRMSFVHFEEYLAISAVYLNNIHYIIYTYICICNILVMCSLKVKAGKCVILNSTPELRIHTHLSAYVCLNVVMYIYMGIKWQTNRKNMELGVIIHQ